MPVYTYTALDAADRHTRGALVAETPAEARRALRHRGLRILDFNAARPARAGGWGTLRNQRRRQEQAAELARYLALLLRAGVALAEALEVLTRQQRGRFALVLKDLRDRITGGQPLAEALAAHPLWFDVLFVSAVRVGELTGQLDQALQELAEHLRAAQQLRGQVAAALAYPAILVCIGTGVVLFLMSYVVPQLLTVLAAAGRPLPAPTLLLKNASDLLIQHGWLALILAGATLAGASAVRRSASGRRALQSAQLRLPLLGGVVQKSIVAQFAQRMALLLRTGVPYVDAARTVAGLSRSVILADELQAVARAVEAGSDIAPAMAHSRIFPPMVVHLMAVGQDSGELVEMLGQLRQRYEHETALAVAKFTAALEPILIVILAAVVGFVVLACMLPILEATRVIA